MPEIANEDERIEILPATAERWPDLEALFGKHGASGGCWCMFWRMKRPEFNQLEGDGTKDALRVMVERNEIPGLLAYLNGQAVGWISIDRREEYLALENSRKLKRLDDKPVWSIVCFFVTRPARGQGIMGALLRGSIAYAKEHGAKIVEGYPIDLQSSKLAGQRLSSDGGYMGIASVFREAGFVEVRRASETQLIMRYTVEG